jgi:hypothetical protein
MVMAMGPEEIDGERAPLKEERSRRRINRLLDRLGSRLPQWGASLLETARNPTARWVRIAIAVALILGGIVGFLPVLGFWMIPLGVILLSLDLPPLARAVDRLSLWIRRRV